MREDFLLKIILYLLYSELCNQWRNNRSLSSIALLALSLVLLAADLDLGHAQSTTQSAYLTPHNSARSQVGVSAVVWNVTLASYAASYAQSQVNKCTQLTHSRGPYGENLLWGSGMAWTPHEVVGYWVGEKAYYNMPPIPTPRARCAAATHRWCGRPPQASVAPRSLAPTPPLTSSAAIGRVETTWANLHTKHIS